MKTKLWLLTPPVPSLKEQATEAYLKWTKTVDWFRSATATEQSAAKIAFIAGYTLNQE